MLWRGSSQGGERYFSFGAGITGSVTGQETQKINTYRRRKSSVGRLWQGQ